MWDKIIYPFPNFNGTEVEDGEVMNNSNTLMGYLAMLQLKWIRVKGFQLFKKYGFEP